MGRKRSKYSKEFKLEAVKRLESGGVSAADLARRLGVSLTNLGQWQAEYRDKKDEAFPGSGKRSGPAAEIDRLKRELEQVKEERDILKKATAFFARESK